MNSFQQAETSGNQVGDSTPPDWKIPPTLRLEVGVLTLGKFQDKEEAHLFRRAQWLLLNKRSLDKIIILLL